MTRAHQLLLVMVLAVIGAWGCAKAPQPTADKLKQLETRVAKLETDLKTAITDRDAVRAKLADTETSYQVRVAELERQVRNWTAKAGTFEKERDDFAAKLQVKSTEREQVQAQFDSFRKNIKELLGQAEASAAAPAAAGKQAPIVAGLKMPGL